MNLKGCAKFSARLKASLPASTIKHPRERKGNCLYTQLIYSTISVKEKRRNARQRRSRKLSSSFDIAEIKASDLANIINIARVISTNCVAGLWISATVI
jgi:hypothetical protein